MEMKLADYQTATQYQLSDGTYLLVVTKCPECFRFLKHGAVWENDGGQVLFTGWQCAKHGEVQPAAYDILPF